MTEHVNLTTVRTRIWTALTSVQIDQTLNTMDLADYNTTVTKLVKVHFLDQYDDWL